jgi:hypothetical protein
MTKYENTCLTFMDIQGFKNLVLKTYPKDPMAIHEILRQFKREQYIEPSDFSIKWCPEIVSFSDSIVRGVSNKKVSLSVDEIIINEVKALRLIQQRLIGWNPDSGGETGIFLRGGLTIGQAFISANENMVFGSAMIRAYELENVKNSPFRIVIDQAASGSHERCRP